MTEKKKWARGQRAAANWWLFLGTLAGFAVYSGALWREPWIVFPGVFCLELALMRARWLAERFKETRDELVAEVSRGNERAETIRQLRADLWTAREELRKVRSPDPYRRAAPRDARRPADHEPASSFRNGVEAGLVGSGQDWSVHLSDGPSARLCLQRAALLWDAPRASTPEFAEANRLRGSARNERDRMLLAYADGLFSFNVGDAAAFRGGFECALEAILRLPEEQP